MAVGSDKPAAACGIEVGKQSGQLPARRIEDLLELFRWSGPGEVAQCVDQGRERQRLRSELHALSGQNAQAGRRRGASDLLDEAGLAHACFPADENESGLAFGGAAQRVDHCRQLRTSPDAPGLTRLAHPADDPHGRPPV